MIFIVQKLKAANCDVEMVVLVKAYFLFWHSWRKFGYKQIL